MTPLHPSLKLAVRFHVALPERLRVYLNGRGIPDAIIKQSLGYAVRFWEPFPSPTPRGTSTKSTKSTSPMRKATRSHNWQLVVIANDFQVPFQDEGALALFERFLKTEHPDRLILNGDFQDFWEISNFDQTPRAGTAFLDEIALGRRILASFRRVLPKAQITWIEGNHEFRLRKYVIAHAAELYGLPGLSVPELFRLRDLRVDYVPCHAAASRFTDTFIRMGQLYVGHWDKVARHAGAAARALVEEKGVSVLQGHTHRFGAHARTTVDGRVLLGIENASMCARRAGYVAHPNWQLGFSVVYVHRQSGRFQWFPVLMGGGGFVWQGREYRLQGARRKAA